MRSNVYTNSQFKPGDLVQVFVQSGNEKRGTWSSPRQVLSIYTQARSVIVPGRAGISVCAAMEDVRAALDENELANAIQDSIDQLDFNLAPELDDGTATNDERPHQTEPDPENHPPKLKSGKVNNPSCPKLVIESLCNGPLNTSTSPELSTPSTKIDNTKLITTMKALEHWSCKKSNVSSTMLPTS